LRMMNAIFSGVQSEAATNRSPSFSRSSSSATMTISPRAKAATTAWIRCWAASISSRSQIIMALALRRRKRPCRRLADLAAMAQIVIGDHARHHGLADRHGANADTWVVTSGRPDFGIVALAIDGGARYRDG